MSQARWQPHVCRTSVGGQTEVKEQICPPPCAASWLSPLFFTIDIISTHFFYPPFTPQKTEGKPSRGPDCRKRYFTSSLRSVVMHFLLFFRPSLKPNKRWHVLLVLSNTFSFVMQMDVTPRVRKRIALETLAAQSSAMTDRHVNCVWRGWF